MSAAVDTIALWRRAICSSKGPGAPGTRLVLLALSLRMEEGPRCSPLEVELAEETGMARASVITHLALAEEDGWLKRRRPTRFGRIGRGYTYEHRFPARFDAAAGLNRANVKNPDIEARLESAR